MCCGDHCLGVLSSLVTGFVSFAVDTHLIQFSVQQNMYLFRHC